MKCKKRAYKDRIAALLALANTQNVDSPTRAKTEKRAYRCSYCKKWHLTSQDFNPATTVKNKEIHGRRT